MWSATSSTRVLAATRAGPDEHTFDQERATGHALSPAEIAALAAELAPTRD